MTGHEHEDGHTPEHACSTGTGPAAHARPRRRTRRALVAFGAVAAVVAAYGTVHAAATPAPAPERASAAALKLVTMTFNTCANTPPTKTRCANGRDTDKVSSDLAHRLNDLHPDTRVVFLQEVCYHDIAALRKKVSSSWTFRFAGIKDEGNGSKPSGTVQPRACAGGRGNFGISVGVKASSPSFKVHYYPDAHVPMARDAWDHWNVHQAAICADVPSWDARVCGTHLTPTQASISPVFRAAQAGQVKDLISYGGTGHRVVLGGDLNSYTPDGSSSSTVVPLYDRYEECDQANYGGARTGEGTYQNADGTRGPKYDYLFADRSASTSCYVTDVHVSASDHLPVYATTSFPAS